MDNESRLQLQKMLSSNDVIDKTELIRTLKHSAILRKEVDMLVKLKSNMSEVDYINDKGGVISEQCGFLSMYYTDLFNKIKNDEIHLKTLYTFLDILKKIETGELDQHEGSFEAGSILKKMYIDSALLKSDKLNKKQDDAKQSVKQKQPIQISWGQFKTNKHHSSPSLTS